MAIIQALVLLTSALVATGQRPFFAGSRPIGYPELLNKTTTPSGLEDKFGEGTTQRLPIEAQGDRELIDRLSKLPIDKQPFWFINWQAYEANREKPQTYPQRPSSFNDPINSNPVNSANSGAVAVKTGDTAIEYRYEVDNNTPRNVNTDDKSNDRTDVKVGTEIKSDKPVTSDANPTTDDKKPNSVKDVSGDKTITLSFARNNGQTVPSVPAENEYEDIEVKKYIKV